MKKKAIGMPGEKMSIDYSKSVVIYASRKPLRSVITG